MKTTRFFAVLILLVITTAFSSNKIPYTGTNDPFRITLCPAPSVITQDQVKNISAAVNLFSDSMEDLYSDSGYTNASFSLTIIPTQGDIHIYTCKELKLPLTAIIKLKETPVGSKIVIDKIRAVSKTGQTRYFAMQSIILQ